MSSNMNNLFNVFNNQNDMMVNNGLGNMYQNNNKKGFLTNPESLFSMAMYDFDTSGCNNNQSQQQQQATVSAPPPPVPHHPGAFYPVEEYRDLSLKEILDLSDDYLFDDSDILGSTLLDDCSPTPIAPNAIPSRNNNCAPVTPQQPQVQVQPQTQQYQSSAMESSNMMFMQPQTVVTSTMVQAPEQGTTLYQASPCPVTSNFESVDAAPKKRQRVSDDEDEEEEDEDDDGRRFRPYQAGQWAEKFDELCEYRRRMGHCLVPHTFSENLPLARWVKRQRYQYKLMKECKPSTMTEERVKALEDIGFVWDSQGAAWGERLGELREFRKAYMHCNVPSNFSQNPQLATWVKCQRRQYKLHMEGKPSNMTPQRIQELESLGFEWELRSYKKARTC